MNQIRVSINGNSPQDIFLADYLHKKCNECEYFTIKTNEQIEFPEGHARDGEFSLVLDLVNTGIGLISLAKIIYDIRTQTASKVQITQSNKCITIESSDDQNMIENKMNSLFKDK